LNAFLSSTLGSFSVIPVAEKTSKANGPLLAGPQAPEPLASWSDLLRRVYAGLNNRNVATALSSPVRSEG
jgi:hypothetical protein